MGEKNGFHAHIDEEHLLVVLLGHAVFPHSMVDRRRGQNRGNMFAKRLVL
jgi:hypothetical protein